VREVGDGEPELLLVTVDALVYTALLCASIVLLLFLGRAWVIVALIPMVGAAWGSGRIATRLTRWLRRWLGRA